MSTPEPSESPTVWVVEGDDHEARLIEAMSSTEAIEMAAEEFAAQYGNYDAELCSVIGAFTGDSFDIGTLVFSPTPGAEDEAAAREALERC